MRPTLLVAAAALALTACGPSADEINAEIEAARACDTADECVLIASRCPFGCTVYVNAAEAERIQSLIDDYEDYGSACAYGCVPSTGVDCQEGLCTSLP